MLMRLYFAFKYCPWAAPVPPSCTADWGRGIWVCLYCDAFEYCGQPMGAYGNGERGVHIAFEVRGKEGFRGGCGWA